MSRYTRRIWHGKPVVARRTSGEKSDAKSVLTVIPFDCIFVAESWKSTFNDTSYQRNRGGERAARSSASGARYSVYLQCTTLY